MNIITAKSKLPIEYINNLNKDFNERQINKILEGYIKDRKTTIRVNRILSNNEEVEKELLENGIQFKKALEKEDFEDAYIIENKTEKDIVKLNIYNEAKIYMQSLSSMMPVIKLEPKAGEKILDMTAAPGSKTTQIASMTNNNTTIVAVELDKIRYDRLVYNIEKQQAKVLEVLNEDARFILNNHSEYKEYFDKILLDTPCSGEGRFLINKKDTYSSWSEKMINNLEVLQRELIDSAYGMLKPGGTLIYSTCTMNKRENESNVKYAINKYKLKKDFEKRIFPSEEMEGFYIARLIKAN